MSRLSYFNVNDLKKLKSDMRYALFQVITEKKQPTIDTIKAMIDDVDLMIDKGKK